MTTLTDRDVVEKWSHIAMKLFPPQMDISVAQVNGSWNVCARWKVAEGGGDPAVDAMVRGVRGVDLHFDEKSITDYLNAGVDAQLKCDLFIEAAIHERLHSFDPLEKIGTRLPAEEWPISLPETGDQGLETRDSSRNPGLQRPVSGP